MQPNQEDGKNSRMQVPGKVLVTRSTARQAGFPLAPAEGFGRGFFCPSGKKTRIQHKRDGEEQDKLGF